MDNKLLSDFISYFEKDKYKFESFCKIFLTWLGFDDVIVTQKSGDKGIDLRCTKKEIDKLDNEYLIVDELTDKLVIKINKNNDVCYKLILNMIELLEDLARQYPKNVNVK